MKHILLIFITILFCACGNENSNKIDSQTTEKTDAVDKVEEVTINEFSSYNNVHSLLKGSWSNMIEPDSVIIFKDSTTTNMYRDMISSENVPYKIGASCANQVDIVPSTSFKYLTTYGTSQECYEIITLNDSTLVLEFKRGNITLSFNRLE